MTDRKTASTITDAELDELYERLAKAEQEADASIAAAAHLTALVGKRSERSEQAAEKQRRRAAIAERELRTLRSGLRANGADPTQLQNLWAQISLRNRQWREEKQRADRAEAEIAACRRQQWPQQLARAEEAIRAAQRVARGIGAWGVLQAIDEAMHAPQPAPAATQTTDGQEQS